MKLHAQLTLDYRRHTALQVFQTIHSVFEARGFSSQSFCTLDNWRFLESAGHFNIHGSLFTEISFVPSGSHRLDLLWMDTAAPIADVVDVLDDLVSRLGARQAFLHSADYYRCQNAEQPMEYELAGKDHSTLPKVDNGLPAPLNAMWIDISANAGRRYLREGLQEAVSSPMWLRHDQIGDSQLAEIRDLPAIDVAERVGHYLIRHDCSPFDESARTEQELLRAACFGRPKPLS